MKPNLAHIETSTSKRLENKSESAGSKTVQELKTLLAAKKLPSKIEHTDEEDLLVVSQSLVTVAAKDLKALAETLIKSVNGTSVKSIKGTSTDDDAFLTFSVGTTKFCIAPYISYEGQNEGSCGGIYVTAI